MGTERKGSKMEIIQRNILIIAVIILIAALLWAAYQYIKFYRTEHLICPKCGIAGSLLC